MQIKYPRFTDKGMVLIGRCSLCEGAAESSNHIFCEYPFVITIWLSIPHNSGIHPGFSASTAEVLTLWRCAQVPISMKGEWDIYACTAI